MIFSHLPTLGKTLGSVLSRGAAAIFVLAAGSAAQAATFEVHRGDDLNVLVVTEEIVPGDDEAFLVALTDATSDGQGALVVLASPGGALGAGMHIGLMIAEAGVPTFVPENEVCASACALAWLAGAPRMMTTESEIGFHQPYDERDGEMIPSIEANAVVGHYIATIGEGPEIVSFAVSAPPDRMAWLDMMTAQTIGLETVEVAASGIAMASAAPGIEGADRRIAPTDEAAPQVASVPLPIMRQLTVQEFASLEMTGAIDGAALDMPLATAFTAIEQPLASPFDAHDLSAPEGELAGFDEMEEQLRPVALETATVDSSSNVELAVLDALRRYGFAGNEGLRVASAACWRELRSAPTLRTLQYCHVFDLVSETMVDPSQPGDFAHFAVEARLREHRDLVETMARPIDDFAVEWRDEATMVVSMMSGQ